MGLFDGAIYKYVAPSLSRYLKEQAQAQLEKAAQPQDVQNLGMRRYQYDYNQQDGSQRRKPNSSVSFQVLRDFSVSYEVARACINTRKRQISGLEFDFVPTDPEDKTDYTAQKQTLLDTFKSIGGYKVRFRELQDMMVEDLLVIDAIAMEKRKALMGNFFGVLPVDSTTIRLRLAEDGSTPEPPEVAYQQVIRGKVMAEWAADEMIYEMMNPRANSPYGLAPMESLVLIVSSALKSNLYNLNYLTDGNIPEGFFGVPDGWSQDQIKEFQEVWDARLSGNSRAGSGMLFVPGGGGGFNPTRKRSDMAFEEFNLWLLKLTCALFDVQPQEIGFTMDVNKATGGSQEGIAKRDGLLPLVQMFEEIWNDIIQEDMNMPYLKFKYMGLEDKDDFQEAQTNEVLIRSGQRSVDEIRKEDGLDPIGVDKPFVLGTPTFIDEESINAKNELAQAAAEGLQNQPPPPEKPVDKPVDSNAKSADAHIQLVTEFRKFRTYALNRKREDKSLRPFNSEVLPETVVSELNTRLKNASLDETKQIFREFMADYQIDFLAKVKDLREILQEAL